MINKLSKRTVRVSSTHRDEAMKLLDLLGVPYVLVWGGGGQFFFYVKRKSSFLFCFYYFWLSFKSISDIGIKIKLDINRVILWSHPHVTFQAPCEAEAQCASLAKDGKVAGGGVILALYHHI